MKEIKFKGNEYWVPENWNEVKLKHIIKVSELSSILEDSPIVAIIAGYSGIPVEDLLSSAAKEVSVVMSTLEFIYDEYLPKPSSSFEFNGVKYSTKSDIADINFEDWVSCQATLYNNRDNPSSGLARLIAAFFKKADESLSDFDLNIRSEEFLELPFPIVKNCESFFLSSLVGYSEISQLSLIIKEGERLIPIMLKELENTISRRKAESGTSWRTRLVLGVYQRYIRSLKLGLEKYFNYGHSRS